MTVSVLVLSTAKWSHGQCQSVFTVSSN